MQAREIGDNGSLRSRSRAASVNGIPTVGIPFTEASRERLRTEPLSPISRACIELAWRYRHQLLGP